MEAGAPKRGARFSAHWALALCLLTACAGGQDPSPFAGPEQGGAGGAIQLAVENRQFADATVYAVTDVGRVRLGTVTGKASERFTFDWPGVRDLRVEIQMLAGATYTTQALTVAPGEQLRLYIERPVYRSVLER